MDLSEFKDGEIPEGFEIDGDIALADDASWRDRLGLVFKPADVVIVRNPSQTAFSWQFMPEENEIQVMNGDRTGYITYRKKPESYTIEAGAEMPILGANAYLMVEGLAKRMIVDLSQTDEKIKSNIMIQGATKEEYIKKIVVRVENPLSMAQGNTNQPAEAEDSLEADLGLIDEYAPRKAKAA